MTRHDQHRSRHASAHGLILLPILVLAAASAAAGPLFMWEVRAENATVTLVGSIHVGKPDFFPLDAPFENAFGEAGALAVEVDMTDPATVQKVAMLMTTKGLLPGETTLKDRLSPELMARLQAFADERDVPLAMYQKFKPGIVAMALVMQEYQRQGFDPELGIDKHFLDQARAGQKPIRELETIEAQMDLFLEIDDQLDDIMLDEFLDQMTDLAAEAAKMVAFWKAGDADGLDEYLVEQMGDDPDMTEFYRKLLDDRNVKMAEKIDAWLHEDQDVFVVVGAGHFAGEMGILKLLTDKGWTVTQAQ